jgi:hypothetical protein
MSTTRPISEAKREANRRNAQRSTGPNTDAGKNAVRFNAVTHGLFARSIVVDGGDCREDFAEFADLLTRLHDEFDPLGAMEEFLVRQIAAAMWKLQRASRAEVGEIRRSGDDIRHAIERRRAKHVRLAIRFPDGEALRRYSAGIEYLLCRLHAISDEVRAGHLTAKANRWFIVFFYQRIVRWTVAMGSKQVGDLAHDIQAQLLGELESQVKELQAELPKVEREEQWRVEAEVLQRALPTGDALSKIGRCESRTSKELHRWLALLQDLQQQRLKHGRDAGREKNDFEKQTQPSTGGSAYRAAMSGRMRRTRQPTTDLWV